MKKEQGFTLVELLIVIAIIGILASVMIPALIGARKRSYDTGAQACAKSVETVQGISQIDRRTYTILGTAAGQINRSTDGINKSCGFSSMFFADRSAASTITSDYAIDIWDTRGSRVYTITPSYLKPDAPGATPFSSDGTGGSNLP